MIAVLALFLLFQIVAPNSPSMWMHFQDKDDSIATGTQRNQSFYQTHNQLDCGMPQLFILPDQHHQNYSIQSIGTRINSIEGLWYPIQTQLSCDEDSNCLVEINNLCLTQENNINWIKLDTQIGDVQYLVNCRPDILYKPFQIGLLLLIILCSITVTLSAKYSRAWSYGNAGYEISKKDIVIFNIIVFLGMVVGYSAPDIVSVVAQVAGSIIGAAGVTVCTSQLLWLCNYSNFKIKLYRSIRLLDLISTIIGLFFIPLYWLLNGQWFVNDFMAICTIVALMKLLKLKSLSLAVLLTVSLLLLQAIVGIFVHYVFQVSYNNYIINIFQNPTILVMPSITKQLYRQCAWLPITSILFPGLMLSYLRRFDVTRATNIYLVIGLASFYLGSILWMVVDMEIQHSLPFAIITQPVTITIICLQSFRRNQFKIIWNGLFYDEQFTTSKHLSFSQSKQTQIGTPLTTQYTDLTANLRLTNPPADSTDDYHVLD